MGLSNEEIFSGIVENIFLLFKIIFDSFGLSAIDYSTVLWVLIPGVVIYFFVKNKLSF